MSASAYAEAIWETVPAGRLPAHFALRRSYLLGHLSAGARVLDVGCGEGHFAEAIADAGCAVTGVDIARIPIERGLRRRAQLDLRLIGAEGSWPFADASFDLVWAGEVIEHVLDTGTFFSELRRMLRPSGTILLSTPGHPPLALLTLALRPARFARHFDPRSDHLRFYNRHALRSLLADFRFTDIEIRAAGGLPLARPLLLASARRMRW
ncbi:MAG TPA: class I SAM-dependent methyltransferase [Solirubrobacteraceae bacterium]|nr:class I SAM-dependent methyltransferase [Solirubrobacteraceae bacterium]